MIAFDPPMLFVFLFCTVVCCLDLLPHHALKRVSQTRESHFVRNDILMPAAVCDICFINAITYLENVICPKWSQWCEYIFRACRGYFLTLCIEFIPWTQCSVRIQLKFNCIVLFFRWHKLSNAVDIGIFYFVQYS